MAGEYGIYKAVVTDNSSFFNTGKIKVRVQSTFNSAVSWDLTANFDKNTFEEEAEDDLDALVYTSMGGDGSGLFALPQINTVGCVQFLNGNKNMPIWMGSYYRPEYDNDGNMYKVGIPHDNMNIEGAGDCGISKTPTDSIAQKRITGDHGTVILKTKKTNPVGSADNPDNMDFGKNRSSNLVVFDDDFVKVVHFSDWKDSANKESSVIKQYEEILIGTHKTYNSAGEVVEEYPQIEVKIHKIDNNDDSDEIITGFTINPDEAKMVYEDKKSQILSTVGATSKGVSIVSQNNKTGLETSLLQDPESILFSNDETNILVEKSEIVLSCPDGKVRISGSEVLLGDGGGYIVTKDSPIPMRMEDGTILKASKCKA